MQGIWTGEQSEKNCGSHFQLLVMQGEAHAALKRLPVQFHTSLLWPMPTIGVYIYIPKACMSDANLQSISLEGMWNNMVKPQFCGKPSAPAVALQMEYEMGRASKLPCSANSNKVEANPRLTHHNISTLYSHCTPTIFNSIHKCLCPTRPSQKR